jgi:tRNA threonylcarbamoyladenosine biosynthesis protein TsaB
MTILVLETSTERGMFAVFVDQNCLFEETLPFGLQNSHLLLSELEKKMASEGLELNTLKKVVVGIGPGSYTGIRIGAIIAKSLAFVYKIPVIGLSTLETFIPDTNGPFAVVIDAKIGGIYLQKSILKDGVACPLTSPEVYPLQEAVHILQDTQTFVTPNAEKIRQKLEAHGLNPHCTWLEKYPSASQMLQAAKEKQGEEGARLELLYLRKTQAEQEKQEKQEKQNKQDENKITG